MHSRIILTGTATALLALTACAGPVSGRATMSEPRSGSTSRDATSLTTAPGSSAPLPDTDPCALLSRDEAEEVTGRLREGPTREDLGTARGCEYKSESATLAIDIREDVGLTGVQAAGEVTDLVIGGHEAKKFLGAGGSCFVVLGVTEMSRVDVVVNSISSGEDPCPLASAVAEVVEPKLP